MDWSEMNHASTESTPESRSLIDKGTWIYVLPGVLLCLAVLVMLIADVSSPEMTEKQYFVYPFICRVVMAISSVVMILQTARSRPYYHGKPDLTTCLFIGFMIWMIISTCINGFSKEALFGAPYRYVGVIDLLVYIIVYMGCSRKIDSVHLRNTFLISYMLTADLICVVFIYDWFIKDIPAIGSENPASAIFFHENHYAYFLVIAIVISAGYFIYGTVTEMIAGLVSMLVNLLALGIGRTAGGFVAVGTTILILIVYTLIKHRECFRKTLILAIVFMFGMLFLIIVSDSLRIELIWIFKEAMVVLQGGDTTYIGHARWTLWKITVDYLVDAPFFGYGCEGISETLYDYVEISNPHNEPLTYAVFFGIPAAIMYVAGCISSIVKGLRIGSSDWSRVIAAFGAMGYLISSLFGVAMFYTAPYLFILLGIAVSNN